MFSKSFYNVLRICFIAAECTDTGTQTPQGWNPDGPRGLTPAPPKKKRTTKRNKITKEIQIDTKWPERWKII